MFNKDEKYIRINFGKKNPFKVPEGYFDTLTPKLMSRLPKLKPESVGVKPHAKSVTVPIWKSYRKAIIGIAASLCVGVFSLGAYLHIADNESNSSMAIHKAVVNQQSEYSNIDAMVDYSMMDTDDMYAYMADLN